MDQERPERQEPHIDYQSQPQPQPQIIQPPAPTLATPQPKSHSKNIIITLGALLCIALLAGAYLLFTAPRTSVETTDSTLRTETAKNDSKTASAAEQVEEAIKNQKLIQSFSYEGWNTYPKDEADLFQGVKYPPPGDNKNAFGTITFSFPSNWRYVSGIDMEGISSRPWYLGEPDQDNKPAATLTFNWRSTDNTNGFEDAVLSTLKNITVPGLEPDDRFTHTLREIGVNTNGKMVAIIDYTYRARSSATSEEHASRGVLGIVDDVRPAYSSRKVSLASSHAFLAADPYYGAKEILSVLSCSGETVTDVQLNECIGIIKSYDKPAVGENV